MKSLLQFIRAFFGTPMLVVGAAMAPAGYDRLMTLRQFREVFPAASSLNSRLFRWLQKAALRQERLNAIKLSKFQRGYERRWQRKFAYLWNFRLYSFLLAMVYGENRLSVFLSDNAPGVEAWRVAFALAVQHGINGVLWHIFPFAR